MLNVREFRIFVFSRLEIRDLLFYSIDELSNCFFSIELTSLLNIENSALIYLMVKFILFDFLKMNHLLQYLLSKVLAVLDTETWKNSVFFLQKEGIFVLYVCKSGYILWISSIIAVLCY